MPIYRDKDGHITGWFLYGSEQDDVDLASLDERDRAEAPVLAALWEERRVLWEGGRTSHDASGDT